MSFSSASNIHVILTDRALSRRERQRMALTWGNPQGPFWEPNICS
jgi:hypothetical protein